MKNILKTILCFTVLLGFTGACFAGDTKTVNVTASIPAQNGLSVSVSKVTGSAWAAAANIDFGGLVYDATHKIFTANSYYAVDVGVNSNAVDWTVTHTRASIVNGAQTLDNNINVSFMKQIDNNNATQIEKVSYTNSNNKAFTKTQLSGGWLRVYYGVATGDGTDAPDVTPVASTTTTGSYSGSVTFTLTP